MTKKEAEIAYLTNRKELLHEQLADADNVIAAAQYQIDREYQDYYDRMDAHENRAYAELDRMAIIGEIRAINRRLHTLRSGLGED